MSSQLADMNCVPCHGGTPVLPADRARELLGELDGWRLDGQSITKSYRFRGFVDGVDFVNRVAAIAEAEGHHPNLRVSWRRVEVEITTHAIRGLSENDFILAAKIDRAEAARAAPTGGTPIAGLGEIALRVFDLDRMQEFYSRAIGLEMMQRFEHIAFFRIAAGVGGHTQILALFDRRDRDPVIPRADATTLDHLAFAIPRASYAAEKARLESLGLAVETAEHGWVRWRSLYVRDPEGNQVELVCYDPTIRSPGR